MPGVNIVGSCSRLRESQRTETTLTVQATVTETLHRESDNGAGITSTWDETLSFNETKTFSRAEFDGLAYYNGGRPAAGTFWLGQPCCCPCRWQIILPDGDNEFSSGNIETHSEWTSLIEEEGEDPIENEGETPCHAHFDFAILGAIPTDPHIGPDSRVPCRSFEDEGNLTSISMIVSLLSEGEFITLTELEAEESQSGTGISLKQTDESPRFVLEAEWGFDKCAGMAITLTGTWTATGHEESDPPPPISTIDEELTCINTIAITLS